MELLAISILSLFLWQAVPSQGKNSILVEAESFKDKGGWVIDQQSMDVMGSPVKIMPQTIS